MVRGRLAELGALREKLKRQIEHAKTLVPEECVEEEADAAEPGRRSGVGCEFTVVLRV